jgi:DNA-binding transcriptional ArsR family regulator
MALVQAACPEYASSHDEVTESPMHEVLSITKALSDETRVRALLSLKDGELCVCQIIQVLGLAPSTVSRHMNLLQQARLVECRKRGKWRFYRLAEGKGRPAARRALAWVLAELRDNPTIAQDTRRIRKIRTQDLGRASACYRPSGLEKEP